MTNPPTPRFNRYPPGPAEEIPGAADALVFLGTYAKMQDSIDSLAFYMLRRSSPALAAVMKKRLRFSDEERVGVLRAAIQDLEAVDFPLEAVVEAFKQAKAPRDAVAHSHNFSTSDEGHVALTTMNGSETLAPAALQKAAERLSWADFNLIFLMVKAGFYTAYLNGENPDPDSIKYLPEP